LGKCFWQATILNRTRSAHMQALSLAKGCYNMKLDLLTNAIVVDDAIRFVAERTKEYLTTNEINRIRLGMNRSLQL
jgi:hypothetical protein